MIYTFEAKLRNMEHEIGNISIARIRQMNPSLKGINNDFVMDRGPGIGGKDHFAFGT